MGENDVLTRGSTLTSCEEDSRVCDARDAVESSHTKQSRAGCRSLDFLPFPHLWTSRLSSLLVMDSLAPLFMETTMCMVIRRVRAFAMLSCVESSCAHFHEWRRVEQAAFRVHRIQKNASVLSHKTCNECLRSCNHSQQTCEEFDFVSLHCLFCDMDDGSLPIEIKRGMRKE